MTKRIPLIAREQKRMYTIFIAVALALFVATAFYTNFNVMTLAPMRTLFGLLLQKTSSRRHCRN